MRGVGVEGRSLWRLCMWGHHWSEVGASRLHEGLAGSRHEWLPPAWADTQLPESFLCLNPWGLGKRIPSFCSVTGKGHQPTRVSEDSLGSLRLGPGPLCSPMDQSLWGGGLGIFFFSLQKNLMLGQGENCCLKESRSEGGAFQGWLDKAGISSFARPQGRCALWEASDFWDGQRATQTLSSAPGRALTLSLIQGNVKFRKAKERMF